MINSDSDAWLVATTPGNSDSAPLHRTNSVASVAHSKYRDNGCTDRPPVKKQAAYIKCLVYSHELQIIIRIPPKMVLTSEENEG